MKRRNGEIIRRKPRKRRRPQPGQRLTQQRVRDEKEIGDLLEGMVSIVAILQHPKEVSELLKQTGFGELLKSVTLMQDGYKGRDKE